MSKQQRSKLPKIIDAADRGYVDEVSRLLRPSLAKTFLCWCDLIKNAVTETDKNGSTALFYSARGGYIGIMRLLIEAQADVNHTNRYGLNPLHWAAQCDQVEAIRVLVESNANVNNAHPSSKKTALFLAASRSKKNGGPAIKSVNTLLEYKADPNIRPDNDVAALHFFAYQFNQFQSTAIALLLMGAKLHLQILKEHPFSAESRDIYFGSKYQVMMFKYHNAPSILKTHYDIPKDITHIVVEYLDSRVDAEQYQGEKSESWMMCRI